MKKLTQQYFIIPDESEFAKSRREYQRNQAQLKEAFAAFAEKTGLESRDGRIKMYTLMIVPMEKDLIKFGKPSTAPARSKLNRQSPQMYTVILSLFFRFFTAIIPRNPHAETAGFSG